MRHKILAFDLLTAAFLIIRSGMIANEITIDLRMRILTIIDLRMRILTTIGHQMTFNYKQNTYSIVSHCKM